MSDAAAPDSTTTDAAAPDATTAAAAAVSPPVAARRAGRTIGFVNLAHGLDHMAMLIFPTAVLAMEAAFATGYAALLPLALPGFILYGALSLPAGWLGDRWSRRGMMLLFYGGMGLSLLATGLARTELELALGLAAIGAFAAIYHPVGTPLLVSQAERVGRTIGLNGVCGNLGVALSAVITGLLIDLAGWRVAFMVPGMLSLAAGIAFARLVPAEPPSRERPATATTARPRDILVRAFLMLAVMTTIGGCVFNAASLILPKLAEARIGGWVTTPGEVGAIVSVIYLWGALAQASIGRVLDRLSIRTALVPLVVLQLGCFAGMVSAAGWWLVLLGGGVMAGLFGQVTVNDAMVARYAADRWRGRVYALRYAASFSASAAAVPLVAWLHGMTGDFVLLLTVMAAAVAAILAAAAAMPGGDAIHPTTA